ncbi:MULTISPECIES: ECF transporter S component [Romboutsia]|uniref:ECF transporter S component n=1 Tax=Romboutsia TaxID=1501226 RepID=UPI001F053D0C|nr:MULTISPECIES: ECF transporter S component [Romboutsia]MCH1958996.1 ECF transporter S component [Romboutsia hominis]MCH1968120.1 ECF transporter S component [Romboutsia hominis]MDB8805906.1 ECF transporter S component [Romboutsia sp. 1001216sp1]MDB8808357.1 ECF transporter S component [Romboutsia sp. 1001216sp1]MDB8811659.1 ECF transporter S component [Romboutsia sp. 1001216sp1]
MQQTIKSNRMFSTSTLVKVGILSAIGYILMFISVPIPVLFPDFLKIDISDLTALLGGIALGPAAGVMIAFLKNLLQFITGMSTTGGVGELANFIIGGSFVWTVSYIYSKKRKTNGLIIGLLLGIIVMTIVGCLSNYFIMLPFYSTIMPIEAVIEMGAAINPVIVDKLSFVIWIIAPFNILKATIMSLLTLPMYKKTEKVLNRMK